METLREKQSRFVKDVGWLISWAYQNGYELTFGEALRTQAEADLNAHQGDGIKNSLHLLKLAIDLNLFADGRFIETTEGYTPLGEAWESLGSDHTWGGRFHSPDADHFSITHNGVK